MSKFRPSKSNSDVENGSPETTVEEVSQETPIVESVKKEEAQKGSYAVVKTVGDVESFASGVIYKTAKEAEAISATIKDSSVVRLVK